MKSSASTVAFSGAFANVWLGNLRTLSGDWHPVILAAGTGLTAWLVLFALYRLKVFLRI